MVVVAAVATCSILVAARADARERGDIRGAGASAATDAVARSGTAATARSPAAQGHAEVALGRLMRLLARRKHGTVKYVEEDYLGILDRPVKSSGVLVYDAPDHLEKRTLRPKRESLVLDGDQLTVQRGRRTYRMQLSAYPQVAPFVAAVRDTLAGNEEGLEKIFEVGLTGSLEKWELQLAPLDEKVARKIKRVEIAGARDEIRTVEILQVDGDRSVMTLEPPTDASATPGASGSSGAPGASRTDASGDHP